MFRILENISYFKANEIAIVRTFTGFGNQETSERELVDSILFEDCVYYCAPMEFTRGRV